MNHKIDTEPCYCTKYRELLKQHPAPSGYVDIAASQRCSNVDLASV